MPVNPHAEHLQELLEDLNEPQREAVTHGEGPLLILAGAGSGKTRVLTHRIAFLIYTDQAQAGEILAITFTNKAAKEMGGRVQRLLGRSTRGMWLMTFHAACARILRAEAERLGYTRQFTIYDQADARRLTKRCADAVGVDPKRYTPAAIHARISALKNRLRAPADSRSEAASPFEEMVADVYELYERDLHRMNAMDFDDLLFGAVNLLELFTEVRERYVSAFRHVLVDEYQDTNYAQYRLLQLLVGAGRAAPARGARIILAGHRNLAVVGDDSQSIYGFRGAEVRNILDFQDDFPDARVVKLEQNYRSTETILRAANAVIANNRGGIAKRLWSELGQGEQIRLRALADEHAEARFVVGEIERLLDEGSAQTEIAGWSTRARGRGREVDAALHGHDAGAAGGGGPAGQPRRGREERGRCRCIARERGGAAGRGSLAQRLPRGARGGAHDRGTGPDREPRTAGRGRPRVRRGRGRGDRDARGLPAADRARRRGRRAPRRGRPHHADDGSQREGTRVPRRFHHRLRGRRLSALARDRRGRARGGAAPVLRGRDARDARAVSQLRATAGRLRRERDRHAQPLP